MILLQFEVVLFNLFLVNLGFFGEVVFAKERHRVAPIKSDGLLVFFGKVKACKRDHVVDVPDVAVEEVFGVAEIEPIKVIFGPAT